ncbi:MAG: molybdenum cofactor biosynthesis protein B [Deltaproteobacteria bacterium]|nr:molybdenum cofactor biosynthesis protein B [Deltaproteobacteria bacterium]MCB9789264.1 molybdenum cofactor biosynthesis protein B [Deltaproteobacteria bacterium]
MSAEATKGLGVAVLTISDTRTEADDTSGALLAERAVAAGHRLLGRRIVRDEAALIREALAELVIDEQVDVVLATGGTGVTLRDVTPEVVEAMCDKLIPGFGELFRWLSFRDIGTSTIQSRATAGVAEGTLIFALPGSTNACRTAWDEILRSQLDIDHRPCNFAELLPRMR